MLFRSRQIGSRNLAKTLERVLDPTAPNGVDDLVIDGLQLFDVPSWEGRAGAHDCPAEEAFGVAAVRDHLERRGDRTRGGAPDRHLLGVAAEGCDVLLDPAEGLALCMGTLEIS